MFNLPMNPMNMSMMQGPAAPAPAAPQPNNMQAFFNNPMTSIGMGLLSGNYGPNSRAAFANAMKGGMVGMQQAQASQQRQLQAEAMKQEMLMAQAKARKQQEMEEKMKDWLVKTRPDLVNAPEIVKEQALKQMFAAPKVHSLSPGAQLVDAQGNVLASTPFKPTSEGSRPRSSESIQLANTIASLPDGDPRKAMLQQRMMYMSGIKGQPVAAPTAGSAMPGQTQAQAQAAPMKDYSKKEVADARQSLDKARQSLNIIGNLKAKVQAGGESLVGARGQVRQLLEGPGANILGYNPGGTPATDVAQDIGILQSNARVPLTGPGNTATAEWERIQKQIQGDDWTSSGGTTLESLNKLEEYMQKAVDYNAPIAGETVPQTAVPQTATPTQADIEFTAKKHNMTVEQVKQKLGIK